MEKKKMTIRNSYVFLYKDKKESSEISESYIMINSPQFSEMFRKSFLEVNVKVKNMFKSCGDFKLNYKKQIRKIKFEYYCVQKNYYLDIFFDCKAEKSGIEIMNIINNIIYDENNKFSKQYIPIISYDSVSEYYCNQLYPLFNIFERKLREILINIYTLQFESKYFENENLKNDINYMKMQSNQLANEYARKDSDSYIKYMFYNLTYEQVEKILFDEYVSDSEKATVEKFLLDNENLLNLDENEIRQNFEIAKRKCDWDRYFRNKKIINFKEDLSILHKNRNNVAHFKLINTENYNKCIKIIKKVNKKLDNAIEITKQKDFTSKNFEMMRESSNNFNKLLNIILECQKSIYDNLEEYFDFKNL